MNEDIIKEIFKLCNWRFPDTNINDEYFPRYNYHDLILFAKEYSKIKEENAFEAGREDDNQTEYLNMIHWKYETFEDYLTFKTKNKDDEQI